MNSTYDEKADVMHLTFGEGKPSTEICVEGKIIKYYSKKLLNGITILDFSKTTTDPIPAQLKANKRNLIKYIKLLKKIYPNYNYKNGMTFKPGERNSILSGYSIVVTGVKEKEMKKVHDTVEKLIYIPIINKNSEEDLPMIYIF
jgi:uncharacterized protein YuzE